MQLSQPGGRFVVGRVLRAGWRIDHARKEGWAIAGYSPGPSAIGIAPNAPAARKNTKGGPTSRIYRVTLDYSGNPSPLRASLR